MNENTFYNLFLNFKSIDNKGEQSNKNVVPTRHCNPAENYLLRIQSIPKHINREIEKI